MARQASATPVTAAATIVAAQSPAFAANIDRATITEVVNSVSVIEPAVRFDRIEIGTASQLGGECAIASLKLAVEDLKNELNRIQYRIKSQDIVLIQTGRIKPGVDPIISLREWAWTGRAPFI